MKTLNTQATGIFARFLRRLNGQAEKTLHSDIFGTYTVRKLQEGIPYNAAAATLYAISRFDKQKGDNYCEVEWRFLVVDKRAHTRDTANLNVYPQYYRADLHQVEEESFDITPTGIANLKMIWQSGHAHSAGKWLYKLNHFGFFKQ